MNGLKISSRPTEVAHHGTAVPEDGRPLAELQPRPIH
jgi:hypothetical protein